PSAMILSAAMLLDHFQYFEAANLIRKAVAACFEEGIYTVDLNDQDPYATGEFGLKVCTKMALLLQATHS
ncbi:MAG: isocitrate/isopropylmalate family dehydrogenase, partial [Bacteroidota bacterium]